MYYLKDLEAKSLTELKEIATQLGINIGNNIAADELVYIILDEQAISASKQQGGEGKKRKKKTQPNKTDKQEEETNNIMTDGDRIKAEDVAPIKEEHPIVIEEKKIEISAEQEKVSDE